MKKINNTTILFFVVTLLILAWFIAALGFVVSANAQGKKLPALTATSGELDGTTCLLENSKIRLQSDFPMHYTVFGDAGKPDVKYDEQVILRMDCDRIGSTWICRGMKTSVKDDTGIGYMDTVAFDAKQAKVMVATDDMAMISIATRLTVVIHRDTNSFSITDVHEKYSGRSEVRCNRVAGKTWVSSTESTTK